MGAAMRFGVRTPATHPIKDVIATVRRAEQAGLDAAWFPDSHLNYRDVWTTLGAVAVATDRIEIGPTVTNLATRHVTVTASAARAVAEAAPGRFILGLGAGDSALGFDNLRPASVAQMEAGVRNLRALLAGETVPFGDFRAQLRGADIAAPIYVAASGPRTLAMAGSVAEGVIVPMGGEAAKIAHIQRGAAEAGRPAPPVFVYANCALVDDVATTSRLLKAFCLRIAELEGLAPFEAAGVAISLPRAHKMGAQGDVGHAADLAEAARQVDHLVSDEAALWYATDRTLVGSEQDILSRLRRLRDLGVAGVTINQLTGSALPDALIETMAPILRRFAQAG